MKNLVLAVALYLGAATQSHAAQSLMCQADTPSSTSWKAIEVSKVSQNRIEIQIAGGRDSGRRAALNYTSTVYPGGIANYRYSGKFFDGKSPKQVTLYLRSDLKQLTYLYQGGPITWTCD